MFGAYRTFTYTKLLLHHLPKLIRELVEERHSYNVSIWIQSIER